MNRNKFEAAKFQNPSREHAVAFAWSWNDVVTEEGIVARLKDMQKAGIGAVYVLPEPKEFRPVTMKTNMQPEYLTDEFMNMMHFFVQTAEKMGFQVWLYDEGGWPSGSACTQIVKKRPDLRRKCIYPMQVELSAGMEYVPPVHHKNFLASFCKGQDGRLERIQDALIMDGTTQVIEYRCMAPTLKYAESEEFFADILHPDTAKLFLELTHEKYYKALEEYFGVFIPYMFDDEPGVDHFAWEPGLETMFFEAYGYDILNYLPVLTEQKAVSNATEKKALSDWRMLISKLAIQNFFLPIRDWCREHRILSIGHLDGDHDAEKLIHSIPSNTLAMEVLRSYDVPGVDVIWRHIFPEGLGTPSFQKSVSFFPRFASSAAAQIGKGLALTESMAVYGEGLTPSIIRYVFGAEVVRGINVFNINSISYTKGKIRPSFRPEKPGYENMTAVNGFLKRLSYLAKLGLPECNTALFMPCRDIAGGDSAKAFHQLGEAMEKCNIYFDVIDEAFVREAESKNNTLCMGLAAYRHVFVPEGTTLPEEVKEKLSGFTVEHGVTADMSLEEAVNVLKDDLVKWADTSERASLKPTVVCENDKFRFMKRIMTDGSCMYFVFNESKDTQAANLRFAERFEADMSCIRLYPEDGRMESCMDFDITLSMGDAAVFWFTKEKVNAQMPLNVVEEIILEDQFTLEKAKEFRITEAGIQSEEYSLEEGKSMQAALGSWKEYFTDKFSGEAVYRTAFRLDSKVLSSVENSEWILNLGKVEYTASVKINGKFSGVAAFVPHMIRFSGALLQEENQLEIRVANTAANQTVSADVYSYFQLTDIGPYHYRVGVMERESLGGGLYGPVVLKKQM